MALSAGSLLGFSKMSVIRDEYLLHLFMVQGQRYLVCDVAHWTLAELSTYEGETNEFLALKRRKDTTIV